MFKRRITKVREENMLLKAELVKQRNKYDALNRNHVVALKKLESLSKSIEASRGTSELSSVS